MASRAKREAGIQRVRIRHPSGWVRTIVCGYVPDPYAEFTADEADAAVYKRWESERFLNKWIGPSKAALFEIIPTPQDTTP